MLNINIQGLHKLLIDLKATVKEGKEILKELNEVKAEIKSVRKVQNGLVRSTDIPEEVMADLINEYPAWAEKMDVKVGELYSYNDKLYEVIQAHTTQIDWKPDTVPALFKVKTPKATNEGTEIIPEFKQPTGAQDSFMKGNKVTFEGKVYESLIDNNAYSPADYPAGWKEIVE